MAGELVFQIPEVGRAEEAVPFGDEPRAEARAELVDELHIIREKGMSEAKLPAIPGPQIVCAQASPAARAIRRPAGLRRPEEVPIPSVGILLFERIECVVPIPVEWREPIPAGEVRNHALAGRL